MIILLLFFLCIIISKMLSFLVRQFLFDNFRKKSVFLYTHIKKIQNLNNYLKIISIIYIYIFFFFYI